MSGTVLAFKDGDSGGPFNPLEITVYLLERQVEEMRAMMRRLIDSEGHEGTLAMAAAEKYLDALDQVDREIEAEEAGMAYQDSPTCDCGTFKGVGKAYCPECDAEALVRLASADTHPKGGDVTQITAPF